MSVNRSSLARFRDISVFFGIKAQMHCFVKSLLTHFSRGPHPLVQGDKPLVEEGHTAQGGLGKPKAAHDSPLVVPVRPLRVLLSSNPDPEASRTGFHAPRRSGGFILEGEDADA